MDTLAWKGRSGWAVGFLGAGLRAGKPDEERGEWLFYPEPLHPCWALARATGRIDI
jgi:hypothetical protein